VQEWGEGPPLVCVHGLGGDASFFSGLGPALADHCRTIAVDLPGCGRSPAVPAVSFDLAASILVDLARHESGQALSVLGHSMGTIVALEAARQAPDLIRSLVLVGGLPEPRDASRARIAERIDRIRREGLAGVGEQAASANFARVTRIGRPDVTSAFARAFEAQSAEDYIAWAEALCGWRARPLPSLEHVPCLVITGEEDQYAPPDAVREFGQALPAGTRIEVMADCGHLPFLEQPLEFAALVGTFLDSGK